MAQTFHEICFSPFAVNVLDLVEAEGLSTSAGKPVRIAHRSAGFDIYVDNQISARFTGLSNIAAAYCLNCLHVGRFS